MASAMNTTMRLPGVSAVARPTPILRSSRAVPRRAFREDKAAGEVSRTRKQEQSTFMPIREAEVAF